MAVVVFPTVHNILFYWTTPQEATPLTVCKNCNATCSDLNNIRRIVAWLDINTAIKRIFVALSAIYIRWKRKNVKSDVKST